MHLTRVAHCTFSNKKAIHQTVWRSHDGLWKFYLIYFLFIYCPKHGTNYRIWVEAAAVAKHHVRYEPKKCRGALAAVEMNVHHQPIWLPWESKYCYASVYLVYSFSIVCIFSSHTQGFLQLLPYGRCLGLAVLFVAGVQRAKWCCVCFAFVGLGFLGVCCFWHEVVTALCFEWPLHLLHRCRFRFSFSWIEPFFALLRDIPVDFTKNIVEYCRRTNNVKVIYVLRSWRLPLSCFS